jgi:hypothetical protein
MSTLIQRAGADLDAGRPWMARDRLVGALRDRQDDEVLDLLAEVHQQLGDLPAAAALWFVTGRDDDVSRAALAAWHERHPTDQRRWNSIPSPVRRHARTPQLIALQDAATRASRAGTAPVGTEAAPEAWWERIVFGGGCLLTVVSTLALIGIGMWTVWQWIWG